MPLFNSQLHWRGIGTTVVVELLVLLALVFGVVSYVEWSSTAAVTEFVRAQVIGEPFQRAFRSDSVPQGGNGLPFG